MDNYAIIFDWWPAEPVYHGFDEERLNERDSEWSRDFTRCGRLVAAYHPESGARSPGKWFPIKHADKFSRPCLICFPPLSEEEK